MKLNYSFCKRAGCLLMESYILSFLFFCLILLFPNITHAVIYINSIEDLQKIGNDPGYPMDEEYELMGNIDASDTINWNKGAGFKLIGSTANLFFRGIQWK